MDAVYAYSDYRLYLKDYYDRHKQLHPGFSYRFLADKAGINSAPFFKFVIEGKRNLTKATILKTCAALGLQGKDAEYFENLVFFNQAKTVQEKSACFDKLVALQKSRNIPVIAKDQMEYFSEWHHCVIRELVAMAPFKDDWAWLGRMLNPPIPPAKAEASVKLLLGLGFLKKAHGRYIQTEPALSTGFGVQDYQVIRFQIRMLQLAIEAYERCRAAERMSSSTTFGVSKPTFDRMVKSIRDFRGHLMEMVRQDAAPDRVCQLNINIIPLTRPLEGQP